MSAAPLDFDPDETDPLEALGEGVTGPEPEPADAVRERFAAAGLDTSLGSLASLAVWWAEVRGDERAAAPGRTVLLGDGPLVPDAVRREPFDPPAGLEEAIAWGAVLADRLADAGTDLVLLPLPLGVTGRALTGYLMGLDPVETNGWPVEPYDDDAWMTTVEEVRDTQWSLRGLRGRPIAMVRALADPRLAAATAFLLQAARRRTPVLLDGPGAVTAALLAARCSRVSSRWWRAAEVGDAPLHRRGLDSLQVKAAVELGLREEDGTGCAAALGLLGLAAGLLARD